MATSVVVDVGAVALSLSHSQITVFGARGIRRNRESWSLEGGKFGMTGSEDLERVDLGDGQGIRPCVVVRGHVGCALSEER